MAPQAGFVTRPGGGINVWDNVLVRGLPGWLWLLRVEDVQEPATKDRKSRGGIEGLGAGADA